MLIKCNISTINLKKTLNLHKIELFNMKQVVLVVVSLLFSGVIFAQNIERDVLSSAGGNEKSTSYDVSWTIGETVADHADATRSSVSHGFQQGLEVEVNPGFEELSQYSFEAYPNPVMDKLIVEQNTGEEIIYRIFNLSGQEIITKKSAQKLEELDMANLATGAYILNLYSEDRMLTSYKIEKHN